MEASIHVPDLILETTSAGPQSPPIASSSTDVPKYRTRVVAYNTYNPRWGDTLKLRFDTYDSMLDLSFLRIEVKNQISGSDDVTIGHFCASLGSLEPGAFACRALSAVGADTFHAATGLRYIPLFDRQMSQFLYSTLLIQSRILPARQSL